MKLRGSLLVIVCCLAVELCNVTRKDYLFLTVYLTITLSTQIAQGMLFLIYPLVGHLTDVYLTRYRSLKWSFGIIMFITFASVVYSIVDLIASNVFKLFIFHHHQTAVISAVIFIVYIIGLGLFQANAIQFGLDQLLEAPTPKLISFIHWYYWAQNVGSLALFYITILGSKISDELHVHIITNITSEERYKSLSSVVTTPVLIAWTIFLTAVLVKFCTTRKYFYIQKAGLNPFKNIYKVLKYSWKHKVPEHRSAFTYWEEDIPRRIDLGKNKYGGPFSNEEVEDTKTFLRILPLLLCLFGYHLAGGGYSAPGQLQRTSCPSLAVLLLIVINPLHMSTLVAVVGIPLYRLVIVKVIPRLKNVRMLTKMWIGLYLSLLQVVLYIIVVVSHDTTYWQQHHTVISYEDHYSITRDCYVIRTGCSFNPHLGFWHCQQYNDPVDNTYLWFIIPQLLNGLSSLLVSMTVFEFICAQAPRTTQGLLIGLWYATFSIRYLVVSILDYFVTEKRSWLISEGVKGFLILVSLVLLSCVSRSYRYRHAARRDSQRAAND